MLKQTLGMGNDLTLLFKSLRKQAKQGRFKLLTEDTPVLPSDDGFILPPEWVDSYDHLLDELKRLESGLHLLETVQTQRLSSVFTDNSKKDQEIKAAYQRVTHMIKVIESSASDIELYEGTGNDQRIRRNISQSVHLKLHQSATRLKKLQHKYIETLAQNDSETLHAVQLELMGDVSYEEVAARDQGINQMLRNLTELSSIFKELSRLVIHQGTILDRIDYNLEQAKESTKTATVELVKAHQHQASSRASLVITVLLMLIGIVVGIHILKHL